MQTWLYHRTEAPRIFSSREEVDEALKAGWEDSPAKFSDPDPRPDERDVLFARAQELGLNPDKRWGVPKLKKVLAGHDDSR